MARAPRYRQRFAQIPLGAADPVWVDAEDFEIDRHVRRSTSSRPVRGRGRGDVAPAEPRPADVGAVDRRPPRRRPDRGRRQGPPLRWSTAWPRSSWRRCSWTRHPSHRRRSATAGARPPPPGAFALFAGGIANRAQAVCSRLASPSAAGRPASASGAAACRRSPLEASRALVDAARPAPACLRSCGPTSPLRHLAMAQPAARRAEADQDTRSGTSVNDVLLRRSPGGIRAFLHETRHGSNAAEDDGAGQPALRGRGRRTRQSHLVRVRGPAVRRAGPCAPGARRSRVRWGVARRRTSRRGRTSMMRLVGYAPRTLQRVASRLVSSPQDASTWWSRTSRARPSRCGCSAAALEEAYPIVPFADQPLAVGRADDGLRRGVPRPLRGPARATGRRPPGGAGRRRVRRAAGCAVVAVPAPARSIGSPDEGAGPRPLAAARVPAAGRSTST